MPTYEVGATTTTAGAAAAYATFNTNARRAFLREMGMFTTAATSTSIGFGVPANAPANNGGGSLTPQAKDAADIASTCTLSTIWTTAPTAPTTFMRKVTLGAAVGAGVIWKVALDERWILATGTKFFVWWNYGGSTGSICDMYVESDE